MPPRSPVPGATVSPLTYSWGQPAPLWGGQNALAPVQRVFEPTGLFSPGQPLVPVDQERLRTWQFPVGYNLVYTPRSWEEVGFAELRALAEYYLVAMAIETRKDQIEKFEWAIVSRDPDSPRSDADRRIAALTEFWNHPDGDTPFATWLRTAVHDVLTIDAPAFEIRRTRGGDIIGLDIVDGATIKVLVDDTGRRPIPPAPAYEQVIHGRPWRLLTTEELLYVPRNIRANHAYGFGPVEQIMLYINIGLRRALTQLHYYTVGNVPEGLICAPEGWSAEQIRSFQEWFDSILSGNLAERNKVVWAPAGAKYQAFKSSPIERDFEEWLARVVCYVYSLPPTSLVNQVNRATGETMQEAAVSEGNQPLMAWTKRLADRVIQRHMGHDDLEFAWQVEDPLDPEDQATMLVNLVKVGAITINEARAERGMDPLPGCDEPLYLQGATPQTIDSIINPPEPPAMSGNETQTSGEQKPGAPADDEEGPAAKTAVATFRQGAARGRRVRARRGLSLSRRAADGASALAILRKAGAGNRAAGL
jgi:HK97 family phage portal protein